MLFNKLEQENRKLKNTYDNLKDGNNSSVGLLDEFQYNYNKELFSFIALILCLLGVIWLAVYYLTKTPGGNKLVQEVKQGVYSSII